MRKKDDDHRLHYAMARTLYLSGDAEAAQQSLDRARKLAPENLVAQFDRPIGDWLAQPLE